MTKQRFQDTGYFAAYWYRQGVDVNCPQCSSHVFIRVKQSVHCQCGWCLVARFCCERCLLVFEGGLHRGRLPSQPEKPAPWYGGYRAWGRRKCGACGHAWVEVSQTQTTCKTNTLASALSGTCGYCQHIQDVVVHWSRLETSPIGREKFFGLPLHFQQEIGAGKIVWAYNRQHLADLYDYMCANVREKKCASSSTYFMRLPAWMKSAKNRKKVTHAIQRMLDI